VGRESPARANCQATAKHCPAGWRLVPFGPWAVSILAVNLLVHWASLRRRVLVGRLPHIRPRKSRKLLGALLQAPARRHPQSCNHRPTTTSQTGSMQSTIHNPQSPNPQNPHPACPAATPAADPSFSTLLGFGNSPEPTWHRPRRTPFLSGPVTRPVGVHTSTPTGYSARVALIHTPPFPPFRPSVHHPMGYATQPFFPCVNDTVGVGRWHGSFGT